MLLVALLALALLAALAAIAGYFYLRQAHRVQWTWEDPLVAVDSSRIRPDLAVIALLDQADGSLVQQAILAGEPDTAYGVLAYGSRSSDAERSGSAQLVGKAFEALGDQDLAALAYQQMIDLAALSPTMADPMRAQVSLDAARGFIRLGLVSAAEPALAQAEALARSSPLLAPIQRQEVARELQLIYRDLGRPEAANALESLIREPRGIPSNKFVRGPFLPQFAGQLTVPDELRLASDERRRQVYTFLQAWDSGDQAQAEAARSTLAGALLAEDRLRRELMPARQRVAVQLPEQTALALDHARWLVLKLMIASGGLGYDLMPEWTQARASIATELRSAYDQIWALYRDQAAALLDPDDGRAARVEILRQQNLLGRLGLYPGYDGEALGFALEQAQRDASDILPLVILRQAWGDGEAFRVAETFE